MEVVKIVNILDSKARIIINGDLFCTAGLAV